MSERSSFFCFCFSNKKKRKGDDDVSGLDIKGSSSTEWGKNEEMLSDMSTFSVKEQERRLKVAMAEEEKVVQEAERVVNWVKQASARLDVSTINRILKEEGNQPTN